MFIKEISITALTTKMAEIIIVFTLILFYLYSPENLASLLEDKVEMTREEKIAMFRNQQNVSVN